MFPPPSASRALCPCPSVPILFDEVGIYSKALTPAEIAALVSAVNVPAGAPSPVDGSFNEPLDTTLSWLSGNPAYEHDVYFGTDAAAVATTLLRRVR